jgi:hydroxymethylglutaryl-CoA lyase
MGIETGVDLEKLVDAGRFICLALGKESNSKAAKAILAKRLEPVF